MAAYKRWLRTAGLVLLPALLFVWFLLPVFHHILNVANAAGMLGCAALILLILRRGAFCRLVRRSWEKGGVPRVFLILIFALLAALILLLAVLCALVFRGMRQPETDADTVIVLGCQVEGTQPSKLLSHRIDSAADYLIAHPDAVCIASGGQGDGENITEAECIRRGLIARGIDPARILLEPDSATTMENLENAKRLMAEHGLTGKVLLVSNNFHLYRALRMAKTIGLDAAGLPAACDWYMLPTYVLREALALVKFRLGG